LLRHVVLEYSCFFRVVSVQPVEDAVDAFGAVGGVVERDAHGCAGRESWGGGGLEVDFGFLIGLVRFRVEDAKCFKCGKVPRLEVAAEMDIIDGEKQPIWHHVFFT